MSTIREQQIGLFGVIGYLIVIIAVVEVVVWSWNLILVLALLVATVPYATWREIQSLEQQNNPSPRPRQTIAKEQSVSQGQTPGRPVTTEADDNNIRVVPPGFRTTAAIKLKGTPYESVECSKA
jgi:hypothetical protein